MKAPFSLQAISAVVASALLATASPARGAEAVSPVDAAALKDIAAKDKLAKAAAEKADKLTKTAESKAKAKKSDADKAAAEAEQARNAAQSARQEADDALGRFNHEREARWIASLGTDPVAISGKARDTLHKTLNGAVAIKMYLRALELGDKYAAKNLAVLHLSDAFGVSVSPQNAIFYLTLPLSRPINSEDKFQHNGNAGSAIAVALKYMPEPDWAEVYSISKRMVELFGEEGSIMGRYRQFLTVIDPEGYPPAKDVVAKMIQEQFPTKQAILNSDWLNRDPSRMMTQDISSQKAYYDRTVTIREQRAADDFAHRQRMFQIFASGMVSMAQTFSSGQGGNFQNPHQMQMQQLLLAVGTSGIGTEGRPGIISMNPFAAALFQEHALMNLQATPVISAASAATQTSPAAATGAPSKFGPSRYSLNLPFGQRSSYEAAADASRQALAQTTDPAQRQVLESMIRQNQRNANLLKSDIPNFNLTSPRPVPPAQVERIIGGSLGPAKGRGAGVAR